MSQYCTILTLSTHLPHAHAPNAGTGKTFVGLKIVQALLQNYRVRKPGPILVVCYTNHALDQFLEGIYNFEPNLIRIGSRSRSEARAAARSAQRELFAPLPCRFCLLRLTALQCVLGALVRSRVALFLGAMLSKSSRLSRAFGTAQVLAQCNLRDKAFEAGRADGALAGARKAIHSRLKELETFIGEPLSKAPWTSELSFRLLWRRPLAPC